MVLRSAKALDRNTILQNPSTCHLVEVKVRVVMRRQGYRCEGRLETVFECLEVVVVMVVKGHVYVSMVKGEGKGEVMG